MVVATAPRGGDHGILLRVDQRNSPTSEQVAAAAASRGAKARQAERSEMPRSAVCQGPPSGSVAFEAMTLKGAAEWGSIFEDTTVSVAILDPAQHTSASVSLPRRVERNDVWLVEVCM